MEKLTISLNGSTETDQNSMPYFIPWTAIQPTLNDMARLRPDEEMIGLILDDVGIIINIGRKRKKRAANKVVEEVKKVEENQS